MAEYLTKVTRRSAGGRFLQKRPVGRSGQPNVPWGLASGGRTLGLKGTTALELITQVEAGLPYRALERFQSASGLDAQELSELVRVPLRTLARRRTEDRLPPEEADRLVRASRVFEQAVGLFEGDAAAATRWLRTPQPGLGNRKPLDLASTDIGAREVEDLIGRLEHGVFS